MDFMKLLKSFEDFIFEAASWLIFYPLTLWRILLHPLKTMDFPTESSRTTPNIATTTP